jgi:hypothetical protein
LFTFLQAQQRTKHLIDAVAAQAKAVDITKARYLTGGYGGETSFSTYTTYEQTLLNVQDLCAQAQGQIATGLITVYRALGGGWELRVRDDMIQTGPNTGANVLPPETEAPTPAPVPDITAPPVVPLPPTATAPMPGAKP